MLKSSNRDIYIRNISNYTESGGNGTNDASLVTISAMSGVI